MTLEEERKFAEENGWKFYEHAGDAVGMTEAEKHEMDFRIALSNAIRKRREKLGLSVIDLTRTPQVPTLLRDGSHTDPVDNRGVFWG